jgi:thioredoxin reductase (NADPH)
MLLEEIVVYSASFAFCVVIVWLYLRKESKSSKKVAAKIETAKQEGLFEPVSLYPFIDLSLCIKSGACVEACPEKDILGILKGGGTLINASNCVGHGACFHACPVEAITLVIGTEKRGVDLPHVAETYESNMPGLYIAGELGGMGLIKNSVEQGAMAVENMIREGIPQDSSSYDLVIVGAGPAGIAASLTAKKHGLNFLTLEQDSLGGTVFTFPRAKVVMTSPVDLPLYGNIRLYDTSKQELLDLWNAALSRNQIQIKEHTQVESVEKEGQIFTVKTVQGDSFLTKRVLLAIGRRGTPRKLGVPGEMSEKVAYRLLEPERITQKNVLVVGGGDSAVESALLLAPQNKVILSYRGDKFSRIKPKNKAQIDAAVESGLLEVHFNTSVQRIEPEKVWITGINPDGEVALDNDLVYIFAGGELPTEFLKKAGVEISRRHGYTMKKHH